MTNSDTNVHTNEVLSALASLAASLGKGLEPEEALNVIVETSLSVCHADKATILLFDPWKKESLKTIVRRAGISESGIEHAVNDVVAGWILKHKEPLHSANLVAALSMPALPDSFKKYGPVLAVPLTFAGTVMGMINLLNDTSTTAFGADMVQALTVIANQSAQYIHSRKLHEQLFVENSRLKAQLRHEYSAHGIVGGSDKMKQVLDTVTRVARTGATVLITGETGTGKELVARAIHVNSDRADKPFVALNCAAIPLNLVESELFGHDRGAFTGATAPATGKFELAEGGTIFLDEIAEMAYDIQAKFLRVLETRKFYRVGSSKEITVDVRVLAASSKDLENAVAENKFREDLYYRLNVFPVHIPPLRERKEDIPIIGQYYLDEFSSNRKKLLPAALTELCSRHWRGNVRELRNVMERIAIQIESNDIGAEQLAAVGVGMRGPVVSNPPLEGVFDSMLKGSDSKKDLITEAEKHLVQSALRLAPGNSSEAARLLGIDRMAFERRKKKFDL